MPYRPKKPCAYTNCPNLTDERYCAKHKGQAPKLRGSSHKRGYGAVWRKVRQMVLIEEPLCRRCKEKGLTVIATMVHHIDGNSSNNNRENLEPLCDPCHRAEHGFANGGGIGTGWQGSPVG